VSSGEGGPALDFRMLGPLRVLVDGHEVPIATRRQRALLVLLLMSVGRVVPTERLIDHLWNGEPPPQGAVTLRSYVSNLRQALGGRDGTGSVLATRGSGYSLDVPADAVDAVRLSRLADEGREHLRHGRADDALAAFGSAVGLWSGDPLAEIADHEVAQSTITQLTETYLGATEGRFEALLATGRHRDAVPLLEAFSADHPLREEPRDRWLSCPRPWRNAPDRSCP
jgi:DNA-binding SARP family transcriptional activator